MIAAGMTVSVYRSRDLGDCTNGGVTTRHDRILLVGDHVPALTHGKPGEEVLVVASKGGAFNAVPGEVVQDGSVILAKGWHMAGGNFVSTSDSRFREAFGAALPVHDRVEGGGLVGVDLGLKWPPHLVEALNENERYQLAWCHEKAKALGTWPTRSWMEEQLRTIACLRVDLAQRGAMLQVRDDGRAILTEVIEAAATYDTEDPEEVVAIPKELLARAMSHVAKKGGAL